MLPEQLIKWKSANVRFIEALGPKQKQHVLDIFDQKLKSVAQAPLRASGEEPNYDADTGQVSGEDEIPGDFGPRS